MRFILSFVLLFLCSFLAFADETTVGVTVPQADLTEQDRASMEGDSQQQEFKAEVHRLMDIIINSLYREREIFLRELISNAADACDKIRFEGLTDKTKLGELTELDIRVSFDKDAKTITVTDKGIGMTKQGLIQNLGVVAHSGTTEFLERATAGQDALSLIGQFGVGFYSVYLIADRVTVVSKHNDDDQHVWESTANKTFTVAKDPRGNTLIRGTSIILHLKEDASEFLNEETLKRIAIKYSEFIQFPIFLFTQTEVEKEVVDEEATQAEAKKEEETTSEEKKEGEDEELSVEDAEEKETEKKPKMKKVKETVTEWKQVNSLKAIWTRSPKDITEEEYNNFFKAITKDDKGSLRHIHFKAEGELAFKSILYVPKKCPDGYYDRFYEKSTSLKLYVRKVLISEEFEDFMPRYLSFIKGVVDSDDLPLNVNRETLAQSRVLKVMGQKLTRKALEMLKKMANEGKEDKEDKEKEEDDEEPKTENVYDEFWGQFGKSIKLGILDDRGNKVALAKLLRYATNKSNGKLRGLQEYITDMPAKQKFIYFVTGENLDAVKSSPFLERATKKGYEVLLMTDPLDEYVVQQLSDFDGKKLASLTKDGELFDDNQDKQKVLEEEYKDLTSWLKGVYGDKVEKVSVSTRLSTSPVVLVTSKYGWSANMERIMKAQTFTDAGQHQYMFGKKTMEINPRHPIIKELKKRTAEDPSDSSLTDLANLLYDSATVSSGFQLNPAEFATRINRVLSTGLKIDPSAMVEEEPEEEPASEEESSDQSSESAPTDTTKEDLLQDILSKVEREGHEDL